MPFGGSLDSEEPGDEGEGSVMLGDGVGCNDSDDLETQFTTFPLPTALQLPEAPLDEPGPRSPATSEQLVAHVIISPAYTAATRALRTI
jgi:hypothetical protein